MVLDDDRALPEPFIPVTNHVGSIVHALEGMSASARGSPSSNPIPSVAQVAANEPDEYAQRPLTR
jgi:hypothetical protein